MGRSIVALSLVAIAVGGISFYTGDILIPALGWIAGAVPPLVIGAILMACGLTKP